MARPPGAPPAHPDLAIGLALARPGEDPGGTGARVLASVAARGHKTGWLGYDRAYTQALPERFHLPARALGYQPVMDTAGQLGIQANTGGAILVEATWYCPALPGPLITATTRLRDHAITRDLYDQQITARCPYQLKHKDGPGTDGYQRLTCPALSRHPALMCPLRAGPASPRDGRAKALQPPAEPPRDLPPDRDHHRRPASVPATARTCPTPAPPGTPGTPRSRNTIEGLNGYVKDPAHQALAQPGRRRVRGIAAQSLFTALLLVAANIRKIRAWRALTADDKTAHRPGHGAAGPASPATSPTADTRPAATPPRSPPASRPAQACPGRPQRNNAITRQEAAGTRPAPVSDPGTILKDRPPPEFCRYDTGSSVGNPNVSERDLNPP